LHLQDARPIADKLNALEQMGADHDSEIYPGDIKGLTLKSAFKKTDDQNV